MHRVARRSPLGFALFFACVLAFAGHVCALPDAYDTHDRAAAAGAGDHNGIDAASCEAVAAQPTQAPALAVVIAPVVAVSVPAVHATLPARPAPAIHRPPRFLLHASLLI